MYGSYVMLAVPMFILAANVMNAGTDQRRARLVGRWIGPRIPWSPVPSPQPPALTPSPMVIQPPATDRDPGALPSEQG